MVLHISLNLLVIDRGYNSALPSSAACERVFSTKGLIFTAKRTNLSDGNFESLVFLKLNGEYAVVFGQLILPKLPRSNYFFFGS